MIIALRRVSKENSGNTMTAITRNLNEKRRTWIKRTTKTGKITQKDDRKTKNCRRKNAKTWRKTNLGMN